MRTARPRFAVLASGRGSNAERLMNAFASGYLDGDLVLVLSDNPEARVLERAASREITTAVVPREGRTRGEHEAEVLATLGTYRAEHLLLAGYMRVLSPWVLDRFAGSILNIHPSLLPEFRGLDPQARQWEAGVTVAGATVHFVDEGIDTGPVLLQGSITVRGDEGPEGLAMRILTEVEHTIYPQAVRLLIDQLNLQEAMKVAAGKP